MTPAPDKRDAKLKKARNIWLATVRPNGAPHLVPIWFVTHADRLYLCTGPESVKVRNLQQNAHVALALEDGSNPTVLEGTARIISREQTPAEAVEQFKLKYDWDILDSDEYTVVIEVTPSRWRG